VKRCTFPLTALECVHTIITDLALIDVTREGLVLREVAPGWTPREVQQCTEANLRCPNAVPEIKLPQRSE
jgi:acyl CoA:acetate/3-ketoacid CoA transferase beta subunit